MKATRGLKDDRGFSAIWTAITAFLLIGVAALAVDVSGFYREATAEQSAADMTCLAGVRDLPQSASDALNHAVAIAKQNWPEMAGAFETVDLVAKTATLDDGGGNTVSIVAGYGGDPTKMAVTVSQQAPTQFGKVLGAQDVQVTQEAYCKVQGLKLGDLPFGALPGGFDGVLQQTNPCETGNCRPLDLPRDDISGSGNTFIRNVAIGAQAELLPVKAPVNPATLVTCAVGSGPCTIVPQNQGVSAGQLSDGLARGGAGVAGRLENLSGATRLFNSLAGRVLNGDYPPQVLQIDPDPGVPVAFAAFTGVTDPALLNALFPPPKFDPDVHANATVAQTWLDVDKSNHIYYDGTIGKCDSPRFARIPIIAQVDWGPGAAVSLPGGNSDPIKIVGFYTVLLEHPIISGDFKNPSDTLKTVSAKAVWFGDNANCIGTGGQVKPYEPGDAKVLRLVDQNG